ncbi:type II secretion system F family protein [Vibrio tubiashii]|uniref:type II secretion system F family protein n=1 Tax=Vibrio tubiashii TaxID=29498 RepID=UPI001EFC9A52|nr:type II secretion system F family protein [Vibrio tubiashii]MCG9581433.1 type II secretion system F family protein [Vibrio tubiashii]MCG9615024.1 type II secretion system F family protein [Vibrio tubiashii]MCG9687919.1 type II secretion system F family protein [Vibrio tubiashii]
MSSMIVSLILFLFGVIAFSVLRGSSQAKQRTRMHKLLQSEEVESEAKKKFRLAMKKISAENKDEFEQKLEQAGIYNKGLAIYYLPAKFGIILATFIAATFLVMSEGWELADVILPAFGVLISVIVVPDMVLASKKKTVECNVGRELPYLIDLMAVCVQTGMTLESALAYLADELQGFDKHLAYHIKRTAERARLTGLESALTELAVRINTQEVRSFTFTLLQSLQHGSSIYQVLITLSKDIREVQMLETEEKIGSLSAKMSVPLIIFIMMPIVILIIAPGVMRLMQ